MNGICEIINGERKVEISNSKFEKLVRESEKIEAAGRYIESADYVLDSVIFAILGIKKAENKEEGE